MPNPPTPLPRKALGLIDQALMELGAASSKIRPLMRKSSDVEIVASAGLALDEINRAVNFLRDAKAIRGDEESQHV